MKAADAINKTSQRRMLSQALAIGSVTFLLLLTLIPFVMTLLLSQKTTGEVMVSLWALPGELRPDFYGDAFRLLWPYIFNSLIICTVVTSGVMVMGSLGGYAFARHRFWGKSLLFMALISLMMIPPVLTLIPGFLWMKEFPLAQGNDLLGRGGKGLLDSWFVYMPFLAGGQIIAIYLFRTFYESVPDDLFAAAKIDGAGELQLWLRIAMPMSLPVFATVGVINFVALYNEYIWPLVTISSDARQVFPVGVTRFQAQGNLQIGPTFAGYIVGSVPLIFVFFFLMRYYVEGLTQGGLKQ